MEKGKHKTPKSQETPEAKDPGTEKKNEVVLSQAEYEKLLEKVKEGEGLKDKLLRSAADYENAKKRLAREKEEYVKFAKSGLIRDLLPILDNLERALSHAGSMKNTGNAGGVISGIQMVFKQMSEALKSQGLVRLETVGKIFDPHLHEAVGYVQEEGKDHEIIEELETGYRLHDRLLRAAKVRVRISPSQEQNPDEEKREEIT